MSISLHADRFCFLPGTDAQSRNVRLLATEDELVPGDAGEAEKVGLAIGSPVNAHDHGYGVRTLGFGLLDDALESWIAGLRLRPRTDPYLETLVAFGRLAKTGVGTTMHCHNSLNADRLVDEAAEVVRAAKDVGIRLALSCPLLDHDPWVYGGPEQLQALLPEGEWERLRPLIPNYASVDTQLQAVEAIAANHHGDRVNVQYGPIGPQWCSDELLAAIAHASRASGRRVHMHLLESPRQRRWLDERFPQGIVTFLDEIGFLSPRLAVAHGVQLRPAEIELLADRGMQLVTNASANLRLRSGVAPLAEARARGLDIAIGLDGTGIDDDQDLWREMRMVRLLHGGRRMVGEVTAAQVFASAVETGRTVTGFEAPADLTIVDEAALAGDLLFDDLELDEVLLTRMTAGCATGLIVGGRWVVREGRLATIDFDAAERELLAQASADLPRLRQERETAGLLADVIKRHYWAME